MTNRQDNRSLWDKYKLLICGAFAALIMILLTIGYIRNDLLRHEAEDALALNLKLTNVVPTTTGQLVQEVKIDKASSAQLKALSDSVFNLRKDKQKLIKQINRLAITKQSVDLKAPIIAQYVSKSDTDSTGIVINSDNCDSLLKHAVITPAPFTYESDSITLAGTVLKEGVKIDLLHVPDTLYERDVKQKTGFLNLGRKNSAQIYHTNSMFSSDEAQVFTVNKTPNWWHRTGKPASAAVISAVITTAIVKAIFTR